MPYPTASDEKVSDFLPSLILVSTASCKRKSSLKGDTNNVTTSYSHKMALYGHMNTKVKVALVGSFLLTAFEDEAKARNATFTQAPGNFELTPEVGEFLGYAFLKWSRGKKKERKEQKIKAVFEVEKEEALKSTEEFKKLKIENNRDEKVDTKNIHYGERKSRFEEWNKFKNNPKYKKDIGKFAESAINVHKNKVSSLWIPEMYCP